MNDENYAKAIEARNKDRTLMLRYIANKEVACIENLQVILSPELNKPIDIEGLKNLECNSVENEKKFAELLAKTKTTAMEIKIREKLEKNRLFQLMKLYTS